MERNELRSVQPDPVLDPILALLQLNETFVEWKTVEARSILRCEGFEIAKRAFLVEYNRVASSAKGALKMPAQPQADSLSRTACGAESVPRKNLAEPEVAARRKASRWVSRLATGKQ